MDESVHTFKLEQKNGKMIDWMVEFYDFILSWESLIHPSVEMKMNKTFQVVKKIETTNK